MFICASLVMLMTLGIALFLGGFVGYRNVLAIMIQSNISLAWTTVLSFAFGYFMLLAPTIGGVIGDPTNYALLHGVALKTMFADLVLRLIGCFPDFLGVGCALAPSVLSSPPPAALPPAPVAPR
jgi:ammonia channel protein AmtB